MSQSFQAVTGAVSKAVTVARNAATYMPKAPQMPAQSPKLNPAPPPASTTGPGNAVSANLSGQVNNTVTKPTYHGNDLRTTATTWGYTLRDRFTGAIMKYGQSINPEKRYSQSWLDKNGLVMKPESFGTKADMRVWEHERIGEYVFTNGAAPAYNNISNSVNVFR